MKIIPARPEDSRLIGKSVVDAIGIEIAESLAGDKHSVDDVVDMFAMLAEREDSQYSYTNTLVAIDDDGKPVGVCIGYDGARLHELRKAFLKPCLHVSVCALRVWRTSVMPMSSILTRLPYCRSIVDKV